jgi:hypothetical protein
MAQDTTDTAPDSAADRAADQATDRRLEILIALVLAAAGLASAWATFQGGAWDKRAADSYALSNSYLTESSQLLIRSGQEQAVAAALFLQFLDAKADGQTLRAEVIANHMPPWFADEFVRWRRELPPDFDKVRPNAALPAFKGPSLAAAQATRAKSDAAQRAAAEAGKIGDSYGIANVILATALFLAGISSVLHRQPGRRLVVALAGVLTAAAIVMMVVTAGQTVT